MSWRRQRARPNLPLLFSRARPLKQFDRVSLPCLCACKRRQTRRVRGKICQAGGAITGTVGFAQIGPRVKRGHKIRQMRRQGGWGEWLSRGRLQVWERQRRNLDGQAGSTWRVLPRRRLRRGGDRAQRRGRGRDGRIEVREGSRVWTDGAPGQRA